ncbi:MAG: alanine racemase [Gemmatimonadetes bacterium]|nr:alanine racemase [Gemmatimonadota bacterium]
MSTDKHHDRAWVEIDLDNLVANANAVGRAASSALLPMVKADGYGLGALPIVAALASVAPWGFGVATIEEGLELAAHGVQLPIIVFTPALAEQLPRLRDHELRPVLDHPAVIQQWDANLPYHCEIDTGMGRAGIRWDDTEALAVVAGHPPEGVFTHFHSADFSPASMDEQLRRFEAALSRLPQRPAVVHVANSAGALRAPGEFDLARPGIFLFGGVAAADLEPPRPVVTVRARVVGTRVLETGESVSYGAEWSAPRRTVVGTVSLGYADGVPRAVQNRASVLVAGRRYPVVGRITMDMMMIDLGPSEQATVQLGDIVTLIGEDAGDAITIDEFADWAGTISYEILTGLGGRLRRVYRRTWTQA